MATDLKLTFFTHADTGYIHMLVSGKGARGGNYRKELVITDKLELSLEQMQEFLADCSYEARNMIPGPPEGYFNSDGIPKVIGPRDPDEIPKYGGQEHMHTRHRPTGWHPSIHKDPGEAT